MESKSVAEVMCVLVCASGGIKWSGSDVSRRV